MIINLPIFITVMPPNVTSFFKALIPIVMFDFIGMFWNWQDHPDFIKFDYDK